MKSDPQQLPNSAAPFFGSNGVEVATDTAAHAGPFHSVYVMADATFSAFDENGIRGASSNAMTGFAIPAGVTIYNGLGINSFTLTSGSVRAYRL